MGPCGGAAGGRQCAHAAAWSLPSPPERPVLSGETPSPLNTHGPRPAPGTAVCLRGSGSSGDLAEVEPAYFTERSVLEVCRWRSRCVGTSFSRLNNVPPSGGATFCSGRPAAEGLGIPSTPSSQPAANCALRVRGGGRWLGTWHPWRDGVPGGGGGLCADGDRRPVQLRPGALDAGSARMSATSSQAKGEGAGVWARGCTAPYSRPVPG